MQLRITICRNLRIVDEKWGTDGQNDHAIQRLPSPYISLTSFNPLTPHYKCLGGNFYLGIIEPGPDHQEATELYSAPLSNCLCHPDAPPSGAVHWAAASLHKKSSWEGPYVESSGQIEHIRVYGPWHP